LALLAEEKIMTVQTNTLVGAHERPLRAAKVMNVILVNLVEQQGVVGGHQLR
jgi:hypothetical protein